MRAPCSNGTILPGIAEEEEGKLKENNLLNEQPPASPPCLPPPGHSIAHQIARCSCLKSATCGHCTYLNNSQFISCGFTQPKITFHQINCQKMQKINQHRQIRCSQREHTHRCPKQGRRKQISRWAPICCLHVPCTWPALPNHRPDVLLHIVRTHMPSLHSVSTSAHAQHMPSRIVRR